MTDANQTQRRTALASFPRSGNTWLRFLIENAVGQLCGSIYQDRIMPRNAAGIAIKTHELDSQCYTHAIHLVRNPFDVIESYFHWKRDVAKWQHIEWEPHVATTVREWRSHMEHWLGARCEIHRLRYEDLKADPHRHLAALIGWLGCTAPEEQIDAAVDAARLEKMRALNAEVGAKFFRRGEVGQSLSSFTAEQRAFVASELASHMRMFEYSSPRIESP